MPEQMTPHGQPWNASTTAQMFLEMAKCYSGLTALVSHPKQDDKRETLTYGGLNERSLAVAAGLAEAGLKPGDRVMILADNRLEWLVTSISVTFAGAVDVPRGNDATNDEINYILNHSASRFLVVEDRRHLERVFRILDNPDGLDLIIVMDGNDLDSDQTEDSFITTLDELERTGKQLIENHDNRIDERIKSIKPSDSYTMIYTSGTTGRPKGVVLTHANMMSQVLNVPITIEKGWRVLSILPIWHSYERAFEMIVLARGIEMTYSAVKTIGADMKEVKPEIMVSAPRLWENVYSRIHHSVHSSNIIKRSLFKVAYASAFVTKSALSILGDQYLEMRYIGSAERLLRKIGAICVVVACYIPYFVLDRLVFTKLRAVIGGRFRCTVSGGGALPLHIDQFFNFIGIRVLEGYGMTESSPVLSVRKFDKLVIGTVGPVYPGTRIRIVDLKSGEILYPNPDLPHDGRGLKGEIHAKGPQIMTGYFRSPEETAKIIHDDWLNTGDLGMVTFNDCVKILGRTKDTIVLLSGENIEPVPIENKIRQSEIVDNCMIVGQDEKYLGLLVVPSVEGFSEIDESLNSIEVILASKEARALIDSVIHEIISTKTGFKAFERIHSWRWINKPFVIGDEITFTFKLKRHVVTRRYESVIRSMFVSETKKK